MGRQIASFYREASKMGMLVEPLQRLRGFSQASPYHQEDVWEHTLMVLEGIPEDFEMDHPLVVAALWHDTGKYTTRAERKDGRGYSFHGHEKESVRLFEEYNNFKDNDKVKFLIKNHMRVFSIGEMKEGKRMELMESPGFADLLLLAVADGVGDSGGRLEDLLGWVMGLDYLSPSGSDLEPNRV